MKRNMREKITHLSFKGFISKRAATSFLCLILNFIINNITDVEILVTKQNDIK